MIVAILREIYAVQGIPPEAIMKITGKINNGNRKKIAEAIRRFKNEKYPNIVVTVDLLTTGIDVPEITTLVFMRRIRSRILFEQMLGRATRLCPEINKTHFEIYDPVGVYEALGPVNTMKGVSSTATFAQLLQGLELLTDETMISLQIDLIVAKLRRTLPSMKPAVCIWTPNARKSATRIEQAEQKVTPEAITSAVTSSALYAYEKYAGRNYCLNSGNTHTFVDNKYRYASGATSTYTGWNLNVSDDLFDHSGSASNIRLSFDLKRTDVDTSAASVANVYTGIWVYYRYNALQGLEVYMGWAYVQSCKGSCSWAMVSYAGYIICSGTVPSGSRNKGNNGQIFDTGVTTDYGTAIPVVTPDNTALMYATTTKSYRGGWRSDTQDVVQGVYSASGYKSSLSWNYGCLWFSTLRTILSGTTIKSATLTLNRKTGSGSGSAKTLYLCAITNTSASGAPSIAVNYGAIGSIGRGETATFAIPVAAVQGLASGAYGGLCLYESPYNFGSSTYSKCYMRMSGADTSQQPYLRVVYNGGDAVG